MQVTETKTEGLSREFKIIVPAADIEVEVTARLTEIGKTANIPGFRAGKAPMHMLKQRYGQQIMGEILERTVNTSSENAIRERELRPAAQPKIEISSFEEGGDLEFTMAIEIMPQVPDIELKDLKLDRLFVDVEDKHVEEGLEELASRHKRYKLAGPDYGAKEGDEILFNFTGKLDGVPFDGGTGVDEEIVLGTGRFIPGYEEQMVGLKAGESKVITVTFPADYRATELAGKDTTFDLEIKEVREPQKVAVDEELAEEVGFASLEELRKSVAENIAKDFEQIARIRLKRTVADALMDKLDFELPPTMVEEEFTNLWQRYQHQQHDHEHGHAHDENCDHGEPEEDEEKKAEIRTMAERRSRLGIMMGEIGHKNNIVADPAEVSKLLQEEAAKYPGQEQQVIQVYQQNPQMMSGLQSQAFEEKVLDFIIEMADVTDKKVPFEEMMMSPDEAAGTKPAAKKKAPAKAKKAAAKKKAPAKAKKE